MPPPPRTRIGFLLPENCLRNMFLGSLNSTLRSKHAFVNLLVVHSLYIYTLRTRYASLTKFNPFISPVCSDINGILQDGPYELLKAHKNDHYEGAVRSNKVL